MRKIVFLVSFLGLFAFAANAQTKSCCASKAEAKTETSSADGSSCSTSAEAEKAAALDASIVKQVSNTGEVSYARKEVEATSGKVTFVAVEYCSKSEKFMDASDEKSSCTKDASHKSDEDSKKKTSKKASKS